MAFNCRKCEVSSNKVNGCYHDGIGWLCDPHFEEFQQLIENFIQPERSKRESICYHISDINSCWKCEKTNQNLRIKTVNNANDAD